MKLFAPLFVACLFLAACNSAKNTPIPQNVENMDALKPAMEDLSPEERDLVAAYILRHTVGAQMRGLMGGGDSSGIPSGMTIGKAIEEQRKFLADQKAEEAKQAALKAALQAKRDAALKVMRDAVTVTLVSKSIQTERGFSGIVMDENLVVVFGYKNNTPKDIAGVKGYISVQDLFGDELSGFAISNDTTIPAGKSTTWTGSRSVRFAMGNNQDRKLADLGDSKFKVVWNPEVIIFSDGTRLEMPKEAGG